MQSKTFTVSFTGIALDKLMDTIATFTLYDDGDGGIQVHEDLLITVSNAESITNIPLDDTPVELQIVNILSTTILIKVSHPTAQNITRLKLSFDKIEPYTRSEKTLMENNYKPLHNFYNGTGNINNDDNYTSPFTTSSLNLAYDRIIDMELQFSFDASVNIIFSDDVNPVRLVNSRWILDENGKYAILADRNQQKDTNTYSEQNFHRTELIPSYNGIPKLAFNGLFVGGRLQGGGYRYFFRYLTADQLRKKVLTYTHHSPYLT